MSKLQKADIVSALAQLGAQLADPQEQLLHIIQTEQHHNAWFTQGSVMSAVKALGAALNQTDVNAWLSRYPKLNTSAPKKVGLILAGNIPLVGLHDVLCVLASGHHALIKASTQDARLVKHVLQMLCDIQPAFADHFSFVERLTDFDAVIATGSNNSSRYFEYYFGKVPNIIRKNRNSVAVLAGDESAAELNLLGCDIFDFFGLGCRNVSKLLVPEGYIFKHFFESIEDHKDIIHHHKYSNNYDYNKSIYLVNGDKHLDNGFLLVKEDERMASPLAVVYFEYYKDEAAVTELLQRESDNIQCIVSKLPLQVPNQVVTFGQSQHPALWDYADGIDTMEFLADL